MNYIVIDGLQLRSFVTLNGIYYSDLVVLSV